MQDHDYRIIEVHPRQSVDLAIECTEASDVLLDVEARDGEAGFYAPRETWVGVRSIRYRLRPIADSGASYIRLRLSMSCETSAHYSITLIQNGSPLYVEQSGRRLHLYTLAISRQAEAQTEDARISLNLEAEASKARSEYVVSYATNRRLHSDGSRPNEYTAERDSEVHYGFCRVFIPRAHSIGSVGSPWWKRLLTLQDDRLKLLENRVTPKREYWSEVAKHLTSLSVEDQHAVVLVHGYNVSFETAALRAAQIGFDLGIRGAMAFFSWPSRGALTGYLADESSIEASEDDICDYLCDFATLSGARMVHVLAHSMGNRGVLRAVSRIVLDAQRKSRVKFGQVLLAAPDVDSDTFRRLCPAYRQIAERTTLYVTTRDHAVEASQWLHQNPRAGLMPPIVISPGIDTVNVANVDLTLLGHGYVSAARDVLQDIHALITRGTPPRERFGLRSSVTEDGHHYWTIGA